MTSSPHGPYVWGYTRATMAATKGSETARWSKSQKTGLSSDWSLQLDSMKLESLVIADQHAAVNTFPGLVHTARHTMGVDCAQKPCRQTARRAASTAMVGDWGEVVTR